MLYIGTGLWLYSNCQVFHDRVYPLEDSSLMMSSGHTIDQVLTEMSPGTVFFIYPCLLLLYYLTKCLFKPDCYLGGRESSQVLKELQKNENVVC